MLRKLLNIYILIILLVKVRNNEAKTGEIKKLFYINNGCEDKGETINVVAEKGNTIIISAMTRGQHYINYSNCSVSTSSSSYKLPHKSNPKTKEDKSYTTFYNETLTERLEGLWNCSFLFERDIKSVPHQVTYENHTYNSISCYFNVTFKESSANELKQPSSLFEKDPNLWIYILIGTLLCVVILVQTFAIVYFKIKAHKITRIESLSLRVRNANNDEKRYSTTPSQKCKISRLFGKYNQSTANGIYETLEELHGTQIPPIPPIETIPTLKRNKKEAEITNRPPIPLPKEVPNDEHYESEMELNKKPLVPVPKKVSDERYKSEMDHGKRPPISVPKEALEKYNSEMDLRKRPPAPLPKEVFDDDDGLYEIHKSETNLKKKPPIPLPKEVSDDDVTDSVREIQRQTTKQLNKEPKNDAKLKSTMYFPWLRATQTKENPALTDAISTTPAVKRTVKSKPEPSVVASELDNIFKKRRNESQKKVPPALQISNRLPQPTANPEPSQTATTTLKKPPPLSSDTKLSPTSKTSPIKMMQMFGKSEPEQSKEVLPPMPLQKPNRVPKPIPNPKPSQPLTIPSSKKPPLMLPTPPQPNQVQESVYEQYEEEPVYNSDEEWTYEVLPKYNIYSN